MDSKEVRIPIVPDVPNILKRGFGSANLPGGRRMFLALSCGYGLFRCANSLLFGFASNVVDLPSPLSTTVPYSLMAALGALLFAAMLCFLASRNIPGSFHLPMIAPTIVLLVAGILSDASLAVPGSFAFMPFFAILYGAAFTCIDIAWLEMLANEDLPVIAGTFASAMLLKCIVPPLFSHAPTWLSVGASIIFVVVSMALLRRSRVAAAASKNEPAQKVSPSPYRHSMMRIGDAIVVSLVLEAVVSVFNGLFLGIAVAEHSALASSLGGSIAAAIFCFMAFAVFKTTDIERLYRYLFPLLLASILLMPLLSRSGSTGALASTLIIGVYAFIYEFIMFSAVYFVIRQVRIDGLNTYRFVSLFVVMLRSVQLVFGVTGFLLGGMPTQGTDVTLLVLCAIAIYGLSLLLLYLTRRRIRSSKPTATADTEDDPFLTRADELSRDHGLTERESQIMLQLARGRSASFIADTLVCSTETVRTHMKSIYSKLGIHSKQELIDLFSDDR